MLTAALAVDPPWYRLSLVPSQVLLAVSKPRVVCAWPSAGRLPGEDARCCIPKMSLDIALHPTEYRLSPLHINWGGGLKFGALEDDAVW